MMNALSYHRTAGNPSVSVILPTRNAEHWIGRLLETIASQTYQPCEILLIDSASEDRTVRIAQSFPNVKVVSIRLEDFDHGATRNQAFTMTQGDIVLFLTQDAILSNTDYIEHMVNAVCQDGVACACGRQVARDDAPLYERYVREFNYPAVSFLRDRSDIPRMGIKAFFLSDVCSGYRRDAFTEVGGFDHPIPTNEDMLIAAKFLHSGYRIAYCAEAIVLHSHEYTFRQEFQRNFKIGRFLEMHRAALDNVKSSGEGLRFVNYVLAKLLKRRAFGQCLRFCFLCAAKVAGSGCGRIHQRFQAIKRKDTKVLYDPYLTGKL